MLDILRLAVRFEAVNSHLFSPQLGPSTLDLLSSFLALDAAPANRMLSLRTLCDAFTCKPGEGMLKAEKERIIAALGGCKGSHNKNTEIALASVMLNYAVLHHYDHAEDAKVQCLSVVSGMIQSVTDPEASFRYLVCLGTLITGSETCSEVAKSLGLQQFVTKCCSIADPKKVSECAGLVARLLK